MSNELNCIVIMDYCKAAISVISRNWSNCLRVFITKISMPAMSKTIAVAIDDSTTAQGALQWAVANFVDGGSKLHILTVTPPISYPVMPTAPIATAGTMTDPDTHMHANISDTVTVCAGAVAAITQTWENEKELAQQRAIKILQAATETVKELGIDAEHIATHTLPAAGGASGVAESIVLWANKHLPDILVLGARGMGWKRPLMSLIGLGSVSDYCVHNSHVPVVVYHPALPANQAINGSELTQVPRRCTCNTAVGGCCGIAHGPCFHHRLSSK